MILTPKLLSLGVLALAGTSLALQDSEVVWTQAELEEVSSVIQAQIEELRGQKFRSPVTVELTDNEGLIQYAKARLEATESEESLHADEMTMKQLGLLAADRNYLEETFALLEGQVGGFYDPGSDSFFLMDRFTGGLAKIILAHELTHALDDQLFDIDGTLERVANTTDADLAYHAVVEGSGLGAMYAWMKAHPGEWKMEDLMGAQSLTGGLEDAPAAVWKPLLASYWLGGAFLSKTDKWRSIQMTMAAPEVSNVAAAFRNPPRSTEQLLHPEKYWDKDSLDEPIAITFEVKELPDGWASAAEDTLGELFLALVATPAEVRESINLESPQAMLSMEFTNEAARGWGGDRMLLLESETGSIVHLVTAWDTSRDAAEFASAMESVRADIAKSKEKGLDGGGLQIKRDGDVVSVTSFSGVESAELTAVLSQVSHVVARPEPIAGK